MGHQACALHRIGIATTSCTAMLRAQGGNHTRYRRAAGTGSLEHCRGRMCPALRSCAPMDRSGHGAAQGRLLRRACDEQGESCAGLTRRHAHCAESGWESIGRWQGRACAHRSSSMTMSAHEGVVATVVLAVVHMPVSSSGPSIAAGCAILGLQVRRVALFRIGLHSPMRYRERHRTMESFSAADGLHELQPR